LMKRRRFDEVMNSFGLRQIESSSKKRALGELARFRQPRSIRDAGAKNIVE
jgi:ubiquinone/menaquinone biosynthesis C-methylase UbiE